MANETYTLIQKTTLNASAASITFSSIPQTFTDLLVKVSARGTTSALYGYLVVKINASTTNYSGRLIYGDNATVGSTSTPADKWQPGIVNYATATASTFASSEFYIPNYTSANYKSVSSDAAGETNSSHAMLYLTGQLWSDTAAITSIILSPDSGNFAQYTSVSLYGVAKLGVSPVAGPKASGGDIITNDGTYWIHQFLNSGTFTPNQTLSTEYLVVAGGGGGGNYIGGGGGAGGYRTNVGSTALSATAQSYTITVGAGGTGGSGASTLPTSGGVSTFSTVSSSGGGAGGGYNGSWQVGTAGGSGGGGGIALAGGAGNSGSYSPVEGYAGGVGPANTGATSTAGGGGGASAVGSAGAASVPGNGGNGSASSITGSSVTRAGGGGGGAHITYSNLSSGGTGGGGAGGYSSANGTAGTTNLGAGGGGAGVNYTGGAGGSGIVIIRYAM